MSRGKNATFKKEVEASCLKMHNQEQIQFSRQKWSELTYFYGAKISTFF